MKKNFINILYLLYKELITYPVYANLSYWWNFGVLSFVCLTIQVLTGIFLAIFLIKVYFFVFIIRDTSFVVWTHKLRVTYSDMCFTRFLKLLFFFLTFFFNNLFNEKIL